MEMIRLPGDPAYRAAVGVLWESGAVREMARYPQHGGASCLLHCLRVSYLSFCRCRAWGLDARAAARGGLLHDLFLYDWHVYHAPVWHLPHGFTHPRSALENARRLFPLTATEEDVILRHMFPLTPVPPATPEGWIVSMTDKYVSLLETCRRPVPLPVFADLP